MSKVVLDFCAGSGAWSQPYVEAGYQVHRFDLPHDVRLLQRLDVPVHGILASPPCTVFANSGAWIKRTDQEMIDALSIVDACLRAVVIYRPQWWALENPIGKLRRYLGDPKLLFHPCDYGDPYTKKTLLWGEFTPPRKRPVTPVLGSKMTTRLGGSDPKQKRMRSMTPPGFARAFFEANP